MKNFVLAKDGLGNRYGLISLTDEQVFITPISTKLKPISQGIYDIDYLDKSNVQVIATLPTYKDLVLKKKLREHAETLRKNMSK